jgi:MerR family mercuric resistance operon transcriptional regulator
MKELTIGALAKAAGVNVETIRFYERRGLLRQPLKPEEGFRKYPIDAVKQVRFIKTAQKLGFSLREIGELLDLGGEGKLSCADIYAMANQKIAEVESKISALKRMKMVLSELVEKCPRAGGLTFCPIWDQMEGIDQKKE